jgi:hypothetical protein
MLAHVGEDDLLRIPQPKEGGLHQALSPIWLARSSAFWEVEGLQEFCVANGLHFLLTTRFVPDKPWSARVQ